MRIALVCPYDWSRPGGVQAHVASLAATLARDHDVRIVAPRGNDEGPALAVPGVDVVDAGGSVGVRARGSVAPVALGPRAVPRALAAVRAHRPDVVHVHEPLAPLVAGAVSTFGPRPLVGTFHAWATSPPLYRSVAPLARRVVARLHTAVAVSPVARDHAVDGLGIPAERFTLVPNGVDVAPFRDAAPLPELADPERPLVLFVGRLEQRKGLAVAVRAWLALRASHPRARLCVVGDGPERVRCARMVPAAARDDVRFAGRVDAATLPRYFASADVFCAPALGGESFGIVLLEAMAAGVPVVASDIPGYRSVVAGDDGGPAGLLCAPGSPEATTHALGRVLHDAVLRKELVAAGRLRADAHDWPRVAAALVDVYASASGH